MINFTVKRGAVVVITGESKIPTMLAVAFNLFSAMGKDLVITSGVEGVHYPDSIHYDLNAIDIRGNHLTEIQRATVIRDFKLILGPDYDVVKSNAGAIHIEYDPKGGTT